MKSPTVLIVDDDLLTRKVVRATLKSAGITVLEAENGRAALEIAARHSPDLILQDLVLPDLDGLELVKQIHALPGATETPVLAYSAFPAKLEQARRLRAGFRDYVLKPIEPSRLLRIVRAHTKFGEEARSQPGRGRSVLVVDDDRLQRKLLKFHLEQLGFVVATAEDGVDGLDQARSSPPDAIVCDILMPRLDGFRLCLAVRQDPQLALIPVVLTSAVFREEADQQLAESAGATAFVLRTPDLREIIEALLSGLDNSDEPCERPLTELPAAEYADQIAKQLSNQAAIAARLSQHLEWVEAKLAILGGIAETVKRDIPVEAVVDDILRRALEATGARRGAAYLLGSEGQIELRAEIGYEDAAGELGGFFGCSDLLRVVMGRREPLTASSADDSGPSVDELLDKSGASAMFIIPLIYGEEPLGVLAVEWTNGDSPQDQQFITTTVTSQVSQAIVLIRTLAEQRLLSESLQRQAQELQRANKELEAFSYSISHDLRAPLRAIDGFSHILLEEEAWEIPPQAQDYLRLVCDNAEQMGHLIDGLLAFARLSRQPLDRREVQTGILVSEVLRGLRPEYEGRRVDVQVGELPPVLADPVLLRQVFTNLLANAIKFTRKREVARIEVGCQQQEEGNVFFVRDNGAGFDMEYADKLFGVFQRLHRVEEYEGTGVGLAIVQRIVERHGGRIWAEAAKDGGATFYLTLGGAPQE